MAHSVVFASEAETDLVELYEYIARHGGPGRARLYVERIVTTCRRDLSGRRLAWAVEWQ